MSEFAKQFLAEFIIKYVALTSSVLTLLTIATTNANNPLLYCYSK